ncbi:MAG: SpoIIE family protein phosphatase [Bacteroidales bacterium]|nr:SpoIIE family protein phosphatase [Bacteroidales bacterium]
MSTLKIKLILFSLIITRISFSQQFLKPDILSLDKGLLNPGVTALQADSKGFIWVGTEKGLYRYDGYRFKRVGHSPAKAGIIGSKRIIKIEIDDSNDNLWLLTDNGVEFYDRNTGITTIYSNQVIHPENIPVRSFIDLYAAANQTIWLITESRLFKMVPGSVISTYPIPHEKNAIPTCIAGDNHGNLWIGTNNGILVFDLNSEKFTELFPDNKDNAGLLTNSYVTCLYKDNKDNLWIGTRSGLNRFDPMDIEFIKLYPHDQQKYHLLNEIRYIYEDNTSNLILITGDGIVYYNLLSNTFNISGIQLPDASYKKQLSSVYVDRQNIMWIGTRRGIIKIREAPVKIQNINADEKTGQILLENNVTAIAEDQDGNIWLGFRNSGITVMDNNLNRLYSYKTGGKGGLSGNSIRSFYTGKDQNFYVISTHAIDKYNVSLRRFESVLDAFPQTERNVFNAIQIYTLVEDSLNNFWVATSEGLVYIDFINRNCKTIRSIKNDQDSLSIQLVYDIDTDPSNNLWLGTNNGLVYINYKRNLFSRFIPYDKNLLNTGHKEVYSITKGRKNTYWIGTSEGCYEFDIQRKTFSAVSSSPDLLSSEIMSVTSDQLNNLWIATSLEIFHYCPSLQSFRHFDFNDGLDNYGFNLNASFGSYRSDVYFGGSNGLTVIRVDSLYTNVSSPSTFITGINLLHKGKVFKDYFEIPDTIKIPHGNYAVKVEFSLPDFSRPERNQFRYSISQQDNKSEWIELYTSNNIILGGLRQGNYKFSVMGSTGNGEWNSKSDDLIISVEVPVWRSRTAYTIYFILILALSVLLFRYWARQLIRSNKAYREREKIAKQIMLQKEELTLKNKSITDSINYARRIQNAMLPPMKLLKSYFPHSFLFYQPKDIVSGDFYWINKLYNKIFISAVDCTGHGVPGAFMSIIGFELFRKITNIEGLIRPSDILNKLNEDFHEIFRDVENIVLRDGMDVAFCAIDVNDMILEFSGAFHPLYLIRDNKITEIKGDRFAIGLDETNFKDQTFKNHMIPLQEGDLIYIFSDGFADQFGGPEGKKFKYRRFRHLLLNIHQLPMENQQNILETSLREWKGEHEQVDDVMILGIKIDF